MKNRSTTLSTHLAARNGTVIRVLAWFEAARRDTGAVEGLGFWDGADDQVFTIDGEDRTYYGAGNLLDIDIIRSRVGLGINMTQIALSPLSVEAQKVLREYDPRLVPAEVHRAFFWPHERTLIEEPENVLKGSIDAASIPTPKKGGTASATLTIAPAARALSFGLPTKKSDAAQRLRDPNDDGRKYAVLSGEVPVVWGDKEWKPRAAASPVSSHWFVKGNK